MVETNDRSNRANGKAWPDEEFIGFMGGIPSTERRLLARIEGIDLIKPMPEPRQLPRLCA